MSKEKKKDDFSVLSDAIAEYMRKQGWNIAVLTVPKVQHQPSALKYNYELVFGFTGTQKEAT